MSGEIPGMKLLWPWGYVSATVVQEKDLGKGAGACRRGGQEVLQLGWGGFALAHRE